MFHTLASIRLREYYQVLSKWRNTSIFEFYFTIGRVFANQETSQFHNLLLPLFVQSNMPKIEAYLILVVVLSTTWSKDRIFAHFLLIFKCNVSRGLLMQNLLIFNRPSQSWFFCVNLASSLKFSDCFLSFKIFECIRRNVQWNELNLLLLLYTIDLQILIFYGVFVFNYSLSFMNYFTGHFNSCFHWTPKTRKEDQWYAI